MLPWMTLAGTGKLRLLTNPDLPGCLWENIMPGKSGLWYIGFNCRTYRSHYRDHVSEITNADCIGFVEPNFIKSTSINFGPTNPILQSVLHLWSLPGHMISATWSLPRDSCHMIAATWGTHHTASVKDLFLVTAGAGALLRIKTVVVVRITANRLYHSRCRASSDCGGHIFTTPYHLNIIPGDYSSSSTTKEIGHILSPRTKESRLEEIHHSNYGEYYYIPLAW